jgi:hypothetical protein
MLLIGIAIFRWKPVCNAWIAAAIQVPRGNKVAYRLCEIVFLMVCGIANCDVYDDGTWGNVHPAFLRGFCEFHYGIPCTDWLRSMMNRVNLDVLTACFWSWVAQFWLEKPNLVAIIASLR